MHIMGNIAYHRTRDGDYVAISQMDNSHLMNTIRLWIRKLVDAREILEGTDSEFYRLVNGISLDRQGAKQFSEAFSVNVAPYIYEANVRGLDIEEELITLRGVLGRASAVPRGVGQLPAIDEDDDGWDWENDPEEG